MMIMLLHNGSGGMVTFFPVVSITVVMLSFLVYGTESAVMNQALVALLSAGIS